MAKHSGKWVLIQITESDEGGWPVQGVLLGWSLSRKRMSEVLLDKLRQGVMPRPYCLFKAIPRARTLTEFREILRRPGIETVDA